jgi:hypothetical protein
MVTVGIQQPLQEFMNRARVDSTSPPLGLAADIQGLTVANSKIVKD